MASKNPLYPGYYPGEKIPPRRSSFRRSESNYQESAFKDISESFDKVTGGFFNVPKWVLEQEKKNLSTSLTAVFYGESRGYEVEPTSSEFSGVEQEEFEEAEGIGVSVSLDPREWVKDPKGQITSFVGKSLQSALEPKDYITKAKYSAWKSLMKDEYNLGAGGGEVSEYYRDVAKNMPDFMRKSNNIFHRNKTFNEYSKSTLSALNNEFKYRVSEQNLEIPKNFLNKIQAIDYFDDLGLEGSNRGDSETISKLLKNIGKTHGKEFFRPYGVDNKEELVKNLTGLNEVLGKASKHLENLEGAEGLRSYVGNLQKILNDHTTIVDDVIKINPGSEARLLKGLTIQGGRLHKMTAGGGVLGGYIRKVMENEVANSNSALNRIINTARDANGNFIMSDASRHINELTNIVVSEWEWGTADDLSLAFSGGKLPNQFLWLNEINPRIQTYTPSYWVKSFLERTHYLGFKANQDVISGDIKGIGFFTKFGESFLKDNTIDLAVGSTAVAFTGGSHLKGLLDFVAKGEIDIDNPGFMNEAVKLIEKLAESNKNNDIVQALTSLGIVKNGKVIKSAGAREALADFLKALKEKEKMSTVSLAASKVGFLERFSTFLAVKIREPVFNFLDKIGVKDRIENIIKKSKAAQVAFKKIIGKLADQLAGLLGKLFAVETGGLSILIQKVLTWIIKFISKHIINRFKKLIKHFWKGLRTLDFTELREDFEKAVIKTLKPLFYLFVGCGMLVTFLFTVIISTFPNYDTGKTCGTDIGDGKCDSSLLDIFTLKDPVEVDVTITGSSTANCFSFLDASSGRVGHNNVTYEVTEWPPELIEGVGNGGSSPFAEAISVLQSKGAYVDKLCRDGEIKLYWSDTDPGYCGHVFGNSIVFLNKPICYTTDEYTTYLFAHETGHVFNRRFPDSYTEFGSYYGPYNQEGPLPSYPGVCDKKVNTQGEDYAETVANLVRKNEWDCALWGSLTNEWGYFPVHAEFAMKYFFDDAGGGPGESF